MLLLHPQESNSTPSLQTSFTSFVDRVMLLRSVSCLHKFHVKCTQSYAVSHVNAWVAAALLCNVQELDLSIPMEFSTVLPQYLFSCRTLVVLKLGTKFVMNVPASVCLASLKILHLDNVNFLDDDTIIRLLFGCPVLEELSMNACLGKDVHIVNIVAPVLTSLIINSMHSYSLNTTNGLEYKIVLDTPALIYLEVNGCPGDGYSIMNLHQLSKAHINIISEFDPIAISDLLRGISNVQFLHLPGHFVATIHVYEPELPKFHHMTCLELGTNGCVSWALLPDLLQNSPRLRTLVFKEGLLDYLGDFDWNPPRKIPSCLRFHLKVIEIRFFKGHEEEMKMVKYFLNKAKVLEKLTLHYIHPLKTQTEGITRELNIRKELLMIERGSKTCQIALL